MITSILVLRFISSFLVGGIFSLVGSLLQSLTQNDLADPGTLGLNAFILIWPLFAVILGVSSDDLNLYSLIFFMSGFLIFILILNIFFKKAMSKNTFSIDKSFILMGICINLFLGSLMSFIHFCMMAINRPFPTYLWYGDFRIVKSWYIIPLIIVYVSLYSYAVKNAKNFQFLTFGTNLSKSFNIPFQKLFFTSLFFIIVSLGVISCLFGMFSFVSLLFPHLFRTIPFFKYNLEKELYWGPVLGGSIFSIFDQFTYHFNPLGVEFPIGIIFSSIGPTLLIFILVKRQIYERNA